MAKGAEEAQSAAETEGAAKFRTTPIADTITHVKQLPKSAILYKCAASSYWQFRVFFDGAQRKRSTKTADLAEAQRQAKLIYADMLQSMHGSDKGKLKLSSKRTLAAVAASLWEKQEAMIAQGELNKQKNKNERYVFEKHIRPFFKDTELKEINADTLERFKLHLSKHKLAKSTQKGYFVLLAKLLNEAVKKQYIHTAPLLPRVRMDDEARGYFTPGEYTKLWKRALKLKRETISVYKDSDYLAGVLKADAKPYRKITITHECYELIMFMRNTYLRPTDVKVLKHKHVKAVVKDGIPFLELHHPATKRHYGVMTSTEYATEPYDKILEARKTDGYDGAEDYIFMPKHANRDYALKELTRQFDVVMRSAGLKEDEYGKSRTLYSLRHTAIVQGIHHGISEQTLAINARTSLPMIDKFYGSHVKGVLKRGTEVVDSVKAKRERYAAKNVNAKEGKTK